MSEGGGPPVIIKRVKRQTHGHHGGAWKVAYADFVTAMMAFFLVMWILGAGTREQKAAISEYFRNPSMTPGNATVAPPGQMGPGGASDAAVQLGGAMDLSHGPGKDRHNGPPGAASKEEIDKQARAQEKARLQELMQQLHENGLQDGLTGCFNRTHAIDSLDIEMKRTRRTKRPLSVLMFDLDSFKLINDRHGHLCGDAVLAAVGDRMRGATRAGDLKCRYGGDEFIVLLPETPLAGAKLVCENLRKAIEKDSILWADGQIALTASFGVTEMIPGEVGPLAVIARADSALYRAKRNGRNRVAVAEETPVAY